MRKWNFNAGPAALPFEVLEQIRDELFDWQGQGASVMEISHRSEAFLTLLRTAEQDVRDLLKVPDNYAVLFMSGGGNAQFAAIPMNLAGPDDVVDYIDTGIWSRRAMSEAKRYTNVNLVASGAESGYTDVPSQSQWKLSPNAVYFHYTPNETIDGVAFNWVPYVKAPLVADMTSCLFSQPIDVSQFGIIYAGAQKNFGIAGLCLVIIRRDLIKAAPDYVPSVLQYQIQEANASVYSTPPVFSWYVASLMFKWMKQQGGVEKFALQNQCKANDLYQAIDESNGFYRNSIADSARSILNVPFRLATPELEYQFITEATAAGFIGLKGHRLQGGIRVSIYNAVPQQAVTELIQFMRAFQQRQH
jgi:phosphoserine aminotransferase